jgi:hypothetical protein
MSLSPGAQAWRHGCGDLGGTALIHLMNQPYLPWLN